MLSRLLVREHQSEVCCRQDRSVDRSTSSAKFRTRLGSVTTRQSRGQVSLTPRISALLNQALMSHDFGLASHELAPINSCVFRARNAFWKRQIQADLIWWSLVDWVSIERPFWPFGKGKISLKSSFRHSSKYLEILSFFCIRNFYSFPTRTASFIENVAKN